MPKHKTREQKIKSDERKLLYTFSSATYTTASALQPVLGNSLALTKKDLQKTALISLIIVAMQLLLFLLLRNHVLAIGFVRY